jgi:hypothetical protein
MCSIRHTLCFIYDEIKYIYGEDCQLRKKDHIEEFISQKKLNLDMVNQFIMEYPLIFPLRE